MQMDDARKNTANNIVWLSTKAINEFRSELHETLPHLNVARNDQDQAMPVLQEVLDTLQIH